MPSAIHVIAGSGGGSRVDGRARSPIEVVFVSTKIGGGDEPPKDEREGESKPTDPSLVDSSPSDDGRSAAMEKSSSKKMPSKAPATRVTDKILSSNAKLTQQQVVRGTMKENASPQKEVSANSSVQGNSKRGDSRNKKHRKGKKKFIDVSDVAAQPPIISNNTDGTSKYQGVTWDKAHNKWQERISVDGKDRHIGLYDCEEEAAVDYARAVFKYGTEESKGRRLQKKYIDLTNVPEQLPIIRSNRNGATSKYRGVHFDKATKKWKAQITIDGKQHHIGCYDDEEEAAVDYARAVFKFRSGDAEVRREQVQKVAVSETGGKSDDSPAYVLMNDAKDTNQGANIMGQEMKEDAVKTALSNHTASLRALFLRGASMGQKSLDDAEVSAVRKETIIALRDANFHPPVYSAIREVLAEAENQARRLSVNDVKILLLAREVSKRPHSGNESGIEQSKKRAKMCSHEDEDSEEDGIAFSQ